MADTTLKIQAEPGKLELKRSTKTFSIEPGELDDLIGKLTEARGIVRLPASPVTWDVGKVTRTSATDPVK